MSVHQLGDVYDLFGQEIGDILAAQLPLVLVLVLDQVQMDRPHFPRDRLLREGPAVLLFLEELQADLAGAAAFVGAQLFAERVDGPLHLVRQAVRSAAHVGEVNEVAIDVRVADRPNGVLGVARVHVLAQAAVKEDGVKDGSYRLVHLTTLHGQIENLRTRVHHDNFFGLGLRLNLCAVYVQCSVAIVTLCPLLPFCLPACLLCNASLG